MDTIHKFRRRFDLHCNVLLNRQRCILGCTMLSKIDPQDVKPVFYSSTFRRCSNLYDPRFHLLDRTASDLTVNTTLGAVSGLMHFTVRNKPDERAEKPKLDLSLPDRLTILPDSVTCTDTEITFEEDAQTILLFYVSNTLSGENITWDELLGKKPQAKS